MIEISEQVKLEALRKFSLMEISYADLLERYLNGQQPTREDLERRVIDSNRKHDHIDLSFYLFLANRQRIMDGVFSLSWRTLCFLLKENWHFKHEDIAMMLAQIRDPGSAHCLFEAASLKLDYLEYDENFQLARKAIKGLAKLGTSDAEMFLDLLANNENEVIAEYARKELRRWGQ